MLVYLCLLSITITDFTRKVVSYLTSLLSPPLDLFSSNLILSASLLQISNYSVLQIFLFLIKKPSHLCELFCYLLQNVIVLILNQFFIFVYFCLHFSDLLYLFINLLQIFLIVSFDLIQRRVAWSYWVVLVSCTTIQAIHT